MCGGVSRGKRGMTTTNSCFKIIWLRKLLYIGFGLFVVLGLVGYFFNPFKKIRNPLPPEYLPSALPEKYYELVRDQPEAILFRSVNVIPLDRDTILYNYQVLIEGNRIVQMASESTPIPMTKEMLLIDGKNQYLIPGLSDMHIHLNDDNNL